MTVAAAIMLVVGVAVPHVVSLRRTPPTVAIVLWLSSLALRALIGLFAVILLVLYLPASELFIALTHWCWHTVLPLLATHLGLDGHQIAGAATLLPGVLLAVSLLSVGLGVARAAKSVKGLLARHALGAGPHDSVIIGGPEIMLAAAGLRRPRILVSAGALINLDDAELAAGIDHERGHIARRHRYIHLCAELCQAIGGFIPGGRRAVREIAFQLERDADRWALERPNDRRALASVICKAALAWPEPALAQVGGAGVAERLRELVDDEEPQRRSRAPVLPRALAAAMVALVLGLTATVPPAVSAGMQRLGTADGVQHCRA